MGSLDDLKAYLAEPGKMRKAAEILFLSVLLVTSFFLYNKLNLSNNRWTVHPDDQDIFIFSKVFLETGTLWYQSPYNDEYKGSTAFRPGLHDFQHDASKGVKIRAQYAPGMYMLVAPGHLLGTRGPFLIVGLLGFAGLLFFYLFMRELFGITTAMVATLLFVMSPPYIYWCNMLFTNAPALCFLMGGIYFLTRVVKNPDSKPFYFLAVAFFAMTVWIRGDYAFAVSITVLAVLIGYRRTLKWKYVGWSAGLLVLLGAFIAGVNKYVSGSFLGINPGNEGTAAKAVEIFVKYPLRSFSLDVLKANGIDHVHAMVPLLVIMALFGLFYCLRSGEWKNPFLVALFIVGTFVFVYYGKNPSYWGYGETWLASSYTRYYLPLYMVLTVFSALFVTRWILSISPKTFGILACALIIFAQSLFSISVLSKEDFGVQYTEQWNMSSRSVDRFVETLPENTVIVNFARDGFYKKMIVSRTVFTPAFIGQDNQLDTCRDVLVDLSRRGIPVYVINNSDRELTDIEKWDRENDSFHLVSVPNSINFTVGAKNPDVYLFVGGK